ncbi:MAG: 50S ribosomal protein L10 [Chlamydiales bacterium]|nr:50S ribosomal protein L10 [Chlamydiales bacterium]
MRPEKQLLLDEIKQKIDSSKAFVLTKYSRLSPNVSAHFRQSLGKSGGSFEVVRKRILIKAAQAAGISLDGETLKGHIGVVFADADVVQTTKAFYEFSKENAEVFQVLGGQFEGKIVSAKDVEQISKLPSQLEMRAQFLATLEAPLGQTLAVMQALLTSVIYCVENKSQSSS